MKNFSLNLDFMNLCYKLKNIFIKKKVSIAILEISNMAMIEMSILFVFRFSIIMVGYFHYHKLWLPYKKIHRQEPGQPVLLLQPGWPLFR